MSYKTILVHVDESRHASERIKLAAAVAMTASAHLIGIAATGASRYLHRGARLGQLDPHFQAHLDFLRERAERGLREFETVARKLGITSFETRLIDDEAGGGICLQARYCDLVVIGQNDPEESSPVVMADFPQYVVMHSGRPVLLVPYAGQHENIGRHVLLAWDASIAATRTVSAAMPLLQRAHTIDVVIFNPESQPQVPPLARDGAPAEEISAFLARHGVKVNIMQRHTDRDIGHALVALANERDCDLIVMGGYGHSRFREILLGGVTRMVFEAMTTPVLMSH